MDLNKKVLESEIIEAVISKLNSSYELSEKARKRISKSGGKLADKLIEIFEKQERKAAEKEDELKDKPENLKSTEGNELDNDLD